MARCKSEADFSRAVCRRSKKCESVASLSLAKAPLCCAAVASKSECRRSSSSAARQARSCAADMVDSVGPLEDSLDGPLSEEAPFSVSCGSGAANADSRLVACRLRARWTASSSSAAPTASHADWTSIGPFGPKTPAYDLASLAKVPPRRVTALTFFASHRSKRTVARHLSLSRNSGLGVIANPPFSSSSDAAGLGRVMHFLFRAKNVAMATRVASEASPLR
mmetsp:Transcript_9415/g.31131  ORF Transcript_9415/g.31131 Transcript_9415/m.31131 type:complete len:222 (+) Transcript_9415:1014-1679(+)